MKLSKDNIGDIVFRYQDGKRILIKDYEEFTRQFTDTDEKGYQFTATIPFARLRYQLENSPYDSVSEVFDGFYGSVDNSVDAYESFMDTLKYTETILNADVVALSEIYKLIHMDPEDREDAARVLKTNKLNIQAINDRLVKDGLARKENLLDEFCKDMQTFNPFSQVKFFGIDVKSSFNNKAALINGNIVINSAVKNELMRIDSFADLKEMKTSGLDNLMSDASLRSGTKESADKSIDKNKDEHERI